jgi:hypothetical protein
VVVGLSAGCDNEASVSFRTGELAFAVSATALALPDELREDGPSGATIRALPCGPMGACPAGASVNIGCEAMVCDPEPTTVKVPLGEEVDIDVYASEFEPLLRRVDAIEIREISYAVTLNTLTVDLGELELWWGPEGSSAGETRLGVVAPLAARETRSGTVELDPAGNAALGAYLEGTSRRVHFFARTRVDLRPGGAFPEGEAEVVVQLAVRVTGPVVD